MLKYFVGLILLVELGSKLTLGAPLLSGDQDKFINLILEEGAKLTEDNLIDDQTVTQEIIGDETVYRHSKSEKHGVPIWYRKGTSDLGKPVVVLSTHEDYLPVCNQKRTFVVLIQSASNKATYRVLFAYIRILSNGNPKVEWDSWSNRGNLRNKGTNFGFIRCSRSSMVPCKKEVQTVTDDSPDYEDLAENVPSPAGHQPHLPPSAHEGDQVDYYCDLDEGDRNNVRFTGVVVGSLVQAMVVLTGEEIHALNSSNIAQDIKDQIQVIAVESEQGRSVNGEASVAGTLERSPSVIAGTVIFYADIVKAGALALGQRPPRELEGQGEDVPEDIVVKYKETGARILKGLLQGTSVDGAEEKRANPNPVGLLKEEFAKQIITGEGPASSSDGQQSGRFLEFIFGSGADVGYTSNGQQAIRQYKGMHKDGSYSGSIAIDNLNAAIDNAFLDKEKSAGQVWSENLIGGIYVPYGFIQDAGDTISGAILGQDSASRDRGFADDLADKIMDVVAGATGQIIDVLGDILGPLGLGGPYKGLAGFVSGALGFVGSVFAAPVTGIYTAVKVGAKALGIGGIIGMNGAESRAPNQGGNQNTNRNSPAQVVLGSTRPDYLPALPPPPPGQSQVQYGRKKRAIDFNNLPQMTAITDVDLFSHVGWQTVEIPQNQLPSVTLSYEEPFIGFGNCHYNKVSGEDFDAVSKNAKALAKLYMQTLRTHCNEDQMEALLSLISKGLLILNEDNTFSVSSKLPHLSKLKISVEEIGELSKAFEFAQYTKAYASQLKSKRSGLPVSRNVATLKAMTMNFLEQVQTSAPNHYVKLTRNLSKFLKTALIKSLQDFLRFRNCPKCENQDATKQSLNNAIVLKALLNFVLLEPQQQEKPEDIQSAKIATLFDKWFISKKDKLTNSIPLYFV